MISIKKACKVSAFTKLDESVDRKLDKEKYDTEHKKLLTKNPYLFLMSAIYKYYSYTLDDINDVIDPSLILFHWEKFREPL